MPEGQDPYGSFAYYQRIRKESLSAINFRRTLKLGTLVPQLNGYAPQSFVLSNPITHVDRVITPILKSRLKATEESLAVLVPPQAQFRTTASDFGSFAVDSKKTRDCAAACNVDEATERAAVHVNPPQTKAGPIEAPSLPALDGKPLGKPSMGLSRAASAAVHRSSPFVPSAPQGSHRIRVGSAASTRKPAAASSDALPFNDKVALLEATLQQERDSRLKVQSELERLERILQRKVAEL